MTDTAVYTLPVVADPVPTPSTDGVYTHNPNHMAEAQAMLIDFFKKARILSLLDSFTAEVQQLEDEAWLVYTGFNIDTAVGDQLDKLGAVVGELRGDRTDANFRAAVKTRILVNSSNGRLEELIAIQLAAVPTLTIETQEFWPASLVFWWTDAFAGVTPVALMQLLQRAKAAGVRLQAVRQNPTTGFLWDTVASAGTADTVHSWGDVALTVGGLIAEVY